MLLLLARRVPHGVLRLPEEALVARLVVHGTLLHVLRQARRLRHAGRPRRVAERVLARVLPGARLLGLLNLLHSLIALVRHGPVAHSRVEVLRLVELLRRVAIVILLLRGGGGDCGLLLRKEHDLLQSHHALLVVHRRACAGTRLLRRSLRHLLRRLQPLELLLRLLLRVLRRALAQVRVELVAAQCERERLLRRVLAVRDARRDALRGSRSAGIACARCTCRHATSQHPCASQRVVLARE